LRRDIGQIIREGSGSVDIVDRSQREVVPKAIVSPWIEERRPGHLANLAVNQSSRSVATRDYACWHHRKPRDLRYMGNREDSTDTGRKCRLF
jgi:hypothetical protein